MHWFVGCGRQEGIEIKTCRKPSDLHVFTGSHSMVLNPRLGNQLLLGLAMNCNHHFFSGKAAFTNRVD